jgi:inhibitor of KinA sporulation pathway (predicted exonuclease)
VIPETLDLVFKSKSTPTSNTIQASVSTEVQHLSFPHSFVYWDNADRRLVDFYVILARPGSRVTKRKRCRSVLGLHQKVTKQQAIKWFKEKYEAVVLMNR